MPAWAKSEHASQSIIPWYIQLTDSCAASGSKTALHISSPHLALLSTIPSELTHPFKRSRVDKVNTEVVTLTYGTIVSSLCRDLTLPSSSSKTDYAAVNAELDRMGHAIGVRLIEDFLAKSNTGTCTSFRETAEVISKVGFKVFMNVTPTVTGWTQDGKGFGLVFEENPLADFVELPDDGRAQEELWYSNILCGVLRGALEMVSLLFCPCWGGWWFWSMLVVMLTVRSRCKCRLRLASSAMCCVAMTRLK